jgi:hypothetical protein
MSRANIYKIVFHFRGDYRYFDFDSNMLANKVLYSVIGDSILDISVDKGQHFNKTFTVGVERFAVEFSYKDCTKLNIYKIDGEDEYLVEENVPYLVLKIENGEDIIYNLTENI